jgi:5-oxoprolinase (ATP-hydrolysing) subunit A
MKRGLDLNGDLGEWESPRRTRALMRHLTSANVACGGHAGDARTMLRCVRLAREFGVRLGAHPGLPDRAGRGRREARVSPDELERLLQEQVGALADMARTEGVRLHHIKLHGALYHATERDPRLARCYVAVVARHWPGAVVYARAGGRVAGLAPRGKVWGEAFVDRAYQDDGSLVPRGEPGAVLPSLRAMREQADRLMETGEVIARSGERIPLAVKTLCLHSDTPQAVRLARALGPRASRPA